MQAVLVTTEGNGIFFGYLENEKDKTQEIITIKNARNCLFFEQTVRGFMGLASTGPNNKCRIGPPVPELTLQKVMSVSYCSKEATENWEKGYWSP